MPDNVTIVGAGHAGVHAAEVLRREGFTGSIVLIGAETHLPYQRPPLSKKLLAGELTLERALLKPATFYKQANIELMTSTVVESIDCAAHTLRCRSTPPMTAPAEQTLSYGSLILCVGSEPRRLTCSGAELGGIYGVRTIDDVTAIRERLRAGSKLVVVGGGYIGLEVAATGGKLGMDVTVLEAADRVMNRVVAPQVSEFFTAEHSRHGVKILCNTGVSGFEGDAQVREVIASDGRRFPADLVVFGVGVGPSVSLAQAAGIACDNGIAVDEYCRTNAPDVYAVGDCVSFPSVRYGRRIRLESVDNAFEQAHTAAVNLLGRNHVHDKLPWFWSDQYDLKLLIVGLSQGYDQAVLRGDPSTRAFSMCYLRDGELIALDSVNNPKDYMAARKLIPDRFRPDVSRLADTSAPLSG